MPEQRKTEQASAGTAESRRSAAVAVVAGATRGAGRGIAQALVQAAWLELLSGRTRRFEAAFLKRTAALREATAD